MQTQRDIEFAAHALWNVGASTDHRIRFTGKNLELRYAARQLCARCYYEM